MMVKPDDSWQEDYDTLKIHYLQCRVQAKTLPGGNEMTLRRQKQLSIMETGPYRTLLKTVANLDNKGKHKDLYRLLFCKLRAYDTGFGNFPSEASVMVTKQLEAADFVDLTQFEDLNNDMDVIDVEKIDLNVLLAKASTNNPIARAIAVKLEPEDDSSMDHKHHPLQAIANTRSGQAHPTNRGQHRNIEDMKVNNTFLTGNDVVFGKWGLKIDQTSKSTKRLQEIMQESYKAHCNADESDGRREMEEAIIVKLKKDLPLTRFLRFLPATMVGTKNGWYYRMTDQEVRKCLTKMFAKMRSSEQRRRKKEITTENVNPTCLYSHDPKGPDSNEEESSATDAKSENGRQRIVVREATNSSTKRPTAETAAMGSRKKARVKSPEIGTFQNKIAELEQEIAVLKDELHTLATTPEEEEVTAKQQKEPPLNDFKRLLHWVWLEKIAALERMNESKD